MGNFEGFVPKIAHSYIGQGTECGDTHHDRISRRCYRLRKHPCSSIFGMSIRAQLEKLNIRHKKIYKAKMTPQALLRDIEIQHLMGRIVRRVVPDFENLSP